MSVDLKIWSNHGIEWGKYPVDVIHNFEKLTGFKVEKFHSQEKEILGTTNNQKEVKYYCFTNRINEDFQNNNEVSIQSNYSLCSEIRILKTSCIFIPSGFFTRWSSWKKLITKEYILEEPLERHSTYDEFYEKWQIFHKYLKNLSNLIRSDEILYINDLSYQISEDLFYIGEEFNKVKKEFEKIGKCVNIDILINKEIDHELGQIWFNEIL